MQTDPNRAFYRDGWLARSIQRRGEAIDMDNWTLHNLTEDFSESVDLRAKFPEKLAGLRDSVTRAIREGLEGPGPFPSRGSPRYHAPLRSTTKAW